MQLPCQGRRVAVSHHRSVPLPSHLFITHLSSLQSLCSEKTILSVISWIFLHFLSSWHLPCPVKMDSEALWPGPSSRDGPEEEPDTRTVTFSGLVLLSLLASSQLLFSSSNSCTISFSSLGFKFLLQTFTYQEEKGEGHISAKNEIIMKSWCPSCQWCGTYRETGGMYLRPIPAFTLIPWPSLQTSVPSYIPPCPSFHQPLFISTG